MNEIGIVGLVLLTITFLVSYKGFKDASYFDQHLFRVQEIIDGKEYQRLLSSGFLHTGWIHLLANAVTFYCFSGSIEETVGCKNFLIIYFTSLLGGNLFSLLLHRHDSRYSAVGASGAITGLVFAAIALYPEMKLGLLGLPYYVPGWLYGMLYVVISAYGVSVRRDNIAHDAHLGGGLVGLATVVSITPQLLLTNYLAIGALVIPSCAFLYLLLRQPEALLSGNFFKTPPVYQSLDDQHNHQQKQREAELDELLDKINRKGLHSLNDREKRDLEKHSR